MNITALLTKLISIESVSGNERMILSFIKKELEKFGLHPFLVNGNLIVKIEGKKRNRALIFNAHVDTVPPGNANQWNNNALRGNEVGDKIFGLGSSDEKSTVAVLMALAEYLNSHKPDCDVWITFVVKEELDGSGTAMFVRWFTMYCQRTYDYVAVILGEPTGLEIIELGHKGNIFLKITTYGQSGHGSKPHEVKKHAVVKMLEVSKKIENLGKDWASKYKDPVLGIPTIGLLTSINAGNAQSPNKFPDSCVATFDIRSVPQMHEKAIREIKNVTNGCKVELVYPPAGCGYTTPHSMISQLVKKLSNAKFGTSDAASDLCFFTEAGIDGVIFGPGEKNTIHKPDEYCHVTKLFQCVEIYEDITEKFGQTD